MILTIKDEMAEEVMTTFLGRAKYYERLLELQDTDEDAQDCERRAKEYWAMVRQFSDPSRSGEKDG